MEDKGPSADSIRGRYRSRILEFGLGEESLGWRKNTSVHRYLAVSEVIRQLEPTRVLDIGSGLGDLLHVLREDGWSGKFVGLDLVPEFVASARELAKSDSLASFQTVDEIFDFQGFQTDFAVSLGLLNHVSTENIVFRRNFLEKLLKVAKVGFAIDFLCDSADRKSEKLVYQNSSWLISWANDNNLKWRIDHSYLRYEYLFVIIKENIGTEDFQYRNLTQ